MKNKYAVPYQLQAPMTGVRLTGGRLERMFRNNIDFLKGFDLDRMLYWYRVHKQKPAPGVPYAWGGGHFENNLKGQTAGEFLSGAGTTLLWTEDRTLRRMVRALIKEMDACRDADGFIIPIPREEFATKEYPNYTRAWITFGLLDAGYAGEARAFELARDMSDYFNTSYVLPYVKDMNLGFQGILANTRQYDAPNGKWEDMQVAIDHYQETWWLEQVIAGDHRAIYDHPGNHPHSTLLTTLEGYLDLYRATGDKLYIRAVKKALSMYEDKWQHVGGGINMCEFDTYWPGCNWLSPNHSYNELCSTNFWVLINQRMHRLEPDDAHYVDEMENSIYNVLMASQVGSTGYHYLNYLERAKDHRFLDRATCCASLGTRLVGLLPQFLYTWTGDTVYADMYAPSEADLPLASGQAKLVCETDVPDGGSVRISVAAAEMPFMLKVRIPRWAAGNVTVYVNGAPAGEGKPSSYVAVSVAAGDEIRFELPMSFRATKYTGGEEIPRRERWALEYGPLLYAAMGAPNPVNVAWDPKAPEDWFTRMPGERPRFALRGDEAHEYWAYADIQDEPFSVYPIVLKPKRQ